MKKNILLLHGAIGSRDQLETLAELLSSDFNVHTINFSGHGGEMAIDDFSIASFATEVKQYIQRQHIDPVNIFGYSMGGYVAMYLALKKPELVTSIITLATKFHWDEGTAIKETKMLDAVKIEAQFPAFAEQLLRRHAPNDWKDLLIKTQKLLIDISENNPLTQKDYKDIQTPSLLMLGDRDKMVSIDETLNTYRILPNAQLALLPGTPHPIEQININQLLFQIKNFLLIESDKSFSKTTRSKHSISFISNT